MNEMSSLDTRNVTRDSLFLFAELTVGSQGDPIRVKVRNLSSGGMMAECNGLAVSRGDRLVFKLRNIGDVKANVAWVQGNRFGVAFEQEIDPKLARAPVVSDGDEGRSPRHTRAITGIGSHSSDELSVRKI